MSQKNKYEVSVGDGKYTFFVTDEYRIGCLRHGEPWIDEFEKGTNALYCLISEMSELREALFFLIKGKDDDKKMD